MLLLPKWETIQANRQVTLRCYAKGAHIIVQMESCIICGYYNVYCHVCYAQNQNRINKIKALDLSQLLYVYGIVFSTLVLGWCCCGSYYIRHGKEVVNECFNFPPPP
jgi:hypothetical protein